MHYLLDQLPDNVQASIEPLRRHYAVGLAHSDPPMHTRLRGVLRKIISPATARARTERVRDTVVNLLDQIDFDHPVEFIRSFAYPLPATVIAEVLGAPVEDIAKFKGWADDIAALFEYGGKMTPEAAQTGVGSLADIRTYILGLLEAARGTEDDTVISALANPPADAPDLSEQELVSTLVTLFVAGHETTTNLLGLSMKALVDRPELTDELRADPSLIPAAVREFLRHEAIVPRAWRMATTDLEMHGQQIRKGQMVMAMLGSANRDADVFRRPQRHQYSSCAETALRLWQRHPHLPGCAAGKSGGGDSGRRAAQALQTVPLCARCRHVASRHGAARPGNAAHQRHPRLRGRAMQNGADPAEPRLDPPQSATVYSTSKQLSIAVWL